MLYMAILNKCPERSLFHEGDSMKKNNASLFLGIFVVCVLALSSISAAGPRPQRGDVMSATPDTNNAQWVTGVSADGAQKGQSLRLESTAPDIAFYSFRNWWDHELSAVTKIRASFFTPTTTVNTGGSPRFSLEVENADGTQMCNGICDGTNQVVIFLDPATCSDAGADGWRDADFTGDRTDCTITDNLGNVFSSDGTQSAWSKLVTSSTYAGQRVWFLYAIQDASTGANYIDRIFLDSAFFTKQP